MFHSKK